MSGFEVAGVVLGSLPIIVSALQLYSQGVKTLHNWRFYQRELKSLIRQLDTERVKLENVLDKLLIGIADQGQIEEMIRDPFGHLWREPHIHKRVRQRLWRSIEVFEATVRDMQEAVDDIRTKLDIGLDGKAEWMGKVTMKRVLKPLAFVVQKASYQELIAQIRSGVSSLESLMALNIELEPERRKRSQGRLFKLIRQESGSIHHALRHVMHCACPNSHTVGMKMVTESHPVVPQDDDEEVMKSLEFHIIISLEPLPKDSDANSSDPVSMKVWQQIAVRCLGTELHQAAASMPTIEIARRKVRFPSLAGTQLESLRTAARTPPDQRATGSQHTMTSTASVTTTATLSADNGALDGGCATYEIDNICNVIRGSQKHRSGICCGHIINGACPSRRRYNVYLHGSLGDAGHWSLACLGDILAGGVGSGCQLPYRDKLRLASLVARSMLQLYGTPWVSTSPTHNDIFLARLDGMMPYKEVYFMKELPGAPRPEQPSTTVKPGMNPSLFALGVLLTELMLGQTITTFYARREDPFINNNEQSALQLLDRVNTAGGSNYADAVRRCIQCESCHSNTAIDDESFQKEVFAIIGRIEEDLEELC
ncbi:hypothetical protein MFIFM68171_04895 [Madurella fahalii]|uniref:DUF7580 domain-containing protein n=1 Tax=Madurella fahalii TaxID=1157608 RepID=A0ABQ0GAS6_9PEZI